MHYSLYNTHARQKRIPGFVVVIALIIVVAGLGFFLKDKPTSPSAQDASGIERVDVVNVRDSGVTIYWRTKEAQEGYIVYGFEPSSVDVKAFDERDVSTHPTARYNHVVTLSHIPHNQKVYFQLVVDGKALGQSAGVPFVTETMRPLKSALDVEPIYGEIGRRSGSVEREAIVIATIGKSRPLLTQTNEDGTFLFAPCCLYSANSQEPFRPSKEDSVRIEIIAEDGTSKLIQTPLASASPLNDRILVDVKDDVQIVADTSNDTGVTPKTAQKPEVLAASDSVIKYEPVDVIYPRDKASIPGTRPLVRGVGEPKEVIKGRFTPMNRLFQITVDDERNWLYQPSFDFTAGEHILTVDTRNAQGQPVHITRTFSILKSGEAVLGNATDSATLTPTLFPIPEVTATASPTSLPITPTPPVTGFSILPFTLISLVLIVIGGGIVLLF